jgi:hypothetical protein
MTAETLAVGKITVLFHVALAFRNSSRADIYRVRAFTHNLTVPTSLAHLTASNTYRSRIDGLQLCIN